MLCAGTTVAGRTEIGLHQLKNRLQDRCTGKTETAAGLFEPRAEILIDQRIENETRFLLKGFHDLVDLIRRLDHGMGVLNRPPVGVLGRRRRRNGFHRFTG